MNFREALVGKVTTSASAGRALIVSTSTWRAAHALLFGFGMNARLLLLALFCSCGVALPALDAGVGDVVVLDGGGSIDAGAILDWPFPFAPNVAVVVDPSVQVDGEACAFSCSNTRRMLPPVLNACELGAGVDLGRLPKRSVRRW